MNALIRLFLFSFFVILFLASPSYAAMQDYPIVKLQALDKSTARTITFEAKVGTTIEYGSLFIKVQSCRKSEPLEKPESAAFLQIWEVPLKAEKSEWVFSGWMFASSPALSAMDHPVYDVWVLDCLDKEKQNIEAQKNETKQKIADQGELEPAENVPVEEDGEEPQEQSEDKPESEEEAVQEEPTENTDNQVEDPIDSLINDAQNFE